MGISNPVKLYFVRHGESEANTKHIISNRESPFHLTTLGKEQAAALAERLSEIPLQAIFCSPVLRARETADILSRSLGIRYQVAEALREYDCGILEEQGDEESWRLHRRYFESWILKNEYLNKPQGGESFLDIQKRFVPFIADLTCNAAYEDRNILLVGHGGLFLLMLPLVLKNIDHSFTVSHGMRNAEYVLAEQVQGVLTCLQWGQVVLNSMDAINDK